jgi:hypothetical protein
LEVAESPSQLVTWREMVKVASEAVEVERATNVSPAVVAAERAVVTSEVHAVMSTSDVELTRDQT